MDWRPYEPCLENGRAAMRERAVAMVKELAPPMDDPSADDMLRAAELRQRIEEARKQ